jgi:hypothetical protein
MMWMLMGVAAAVEIGPSAEGMVEDTPQATTAEPTLLDQARLNRLWLSSNDEGAAEDAALIQQTIAKYSEAATRVFIGEVVGVYHPGGHAVQGTRVNMVVSEVIRGEVPSVLEVHVPPAGGYIPHDPLSAPTTIINGYKMLVFADKKGNAVASSALFLIEGGFIWRNKSPDVFLNPRASRDWDLLDPSEDYLIADLSAVKDQIGRR